MITSLAADPYAPKDIASLWTSFVERTASGIGMARTSDGVLVFANAAFAETAGASTEELKGHPLADLMSEADARAALDPEGDHPHPLDIVFNAPDGRLVAAAVEGTAIHDGAFVVLMLIGEVQGGNYREQQQQRRRQRRADDRNTELERYGREQNEELTAAVEELRAFTYSVSHDLRAPIRAIDSFSKILEDEQGARLDDDGRRLISVVRRSTHQMSRLIDGLLDFSRMGRLELQRSVIDMDEAAGSVLEELRAAEPDRVVEISVEPLGKAWGDPTMIRQVLANVIGNAWKFTSREAPGHIQIRREAGRDDEDVFAVSDDGAGFDDSYSEKLFGVFERLHTVEEFEGSGIGLAHAQRLLQRHGGRIWAEGRPDEGATFRFAVPRRPLQEPA